MTFCVERDPGIKECDLDIEGLFDLCARKALQYTGCPFECEVDLTVTTDSEIRQLNRQFRDIDEPTDVLSFPLLEFEEPGRFDISEEDHMDCFDPESDELMLGSIVINLDRAEQQALSFGHSLKREMAFLIIHSMLHLQGFDHMEDNDRIVMEKAQEEILDDLGITREAALEE
ncbi:MAG: rRNA maturation RNase YbeY [Lachnospiraceae bacterium]|nr:rRNA maturation RNase YbeY [Lachnospiraceae bacterium]